MRHRRLALVLTLLAASLLSSCAKKESAPAAPAPKSWPVSRSYGAGPVKFTVEASAEKITTADALTLRMKLDVGPDYQAEFPDVMLPDDMPGAILTDYDETDETRGDRHVITRTFELEPEYEGTLRLPEMEVFYHREGEVAEDFFAAAPLEIPVEPVDASADDLAFKPMRDLVTVEEITEDERNPLLWVGLGAAGVIALGVAGLYLLRRQKPAPPPPPAHETALARLQELARRGLIDQGRAEPFFVAVTLIVRDYIEQAYGLRAPEQTTEEFLAHLADAPAVAKHRETLEPFLVAADEVKFARLGSDRDAMQRAFETAEAFVRVSSGTNNTGGSA